MYLGLACQPLLRLEKAMTYGTGTPLKAVAGRLALDFVNTADWTPFDTVLKDRIASLADLSAWTAGMGLPEAHWYGTLEALHDFRAGVRRAILDQGSLDLGFALPTPEQPFAQWLRRQALRDLVAASALSILADPRELKRVKLCPGHDCGWLFLDETKNARRKWCLMEVCGNRAKSSRHYARTIGLEVETPTVR